MNHPSVSDLELVANDALQDTATLHADLKAMLADEGPHCPSAAKLEEWKVMAMRANKAISRLARLAWMADDRRNIEMTILLESMKRDSLDREATFAHTWGKLRQQSATLNGEGPSIFVDRAQSAAHQVESALAALAPVAHTHYHGAPALALLQ
jgi:hypothetical protein